MQPPEPTLRLRVDDDALAHNWRTLDRLSGRAAAGAAVKANCYGLGVDRCVPVLRDAGCRSFFVAHWSEVAAVARHVPATWISVLHGVLNDQEAQYARETGAIPVINSIEQARRWKAADGSACNLMVDTGINRLGISPDELDDPAIQNLSVETIMSHLASADEDIAMNKRQLQHFQACLNQVEHSAASLANSAGIALGTEYAFDLTRPGLALYGGVPRSELSGEIKQVAQLEAAIMQVRTLKPGDAVGYNGEYVAGEEMRVATVSLGYADGFLRSMGRGNALVHGGDRLAILGKVSMDMIVVDLSAAPQLREGDWLNIPFDLPHAAQQSTLSPYEMLTVLGSRWGS